MSQSYQIPAEAAGERLDVVLAQITRQTRSQLQKQLKAGRIVLNGKEVSAKFVVQGGETVSMEAAPTAEAPEVPDLQVLYEDNDVIAVDKPAGLVVHLPESGRSMPTVAAYAASVGVEDDDEERPGIVHRLDRDTSGVLLIAKHPDSKRYLQEQFRNRQIHKTYLALVRGRLQSDEATIRLPIDRSRKQPTKRAVVPGGQEAITHYRVIEQLSGASLVEVELETGRTHQIRVHLAHLGHPVIGDELYGAADKRLGRQYLHATELSFTNMDGKKVTVKSPLPPDLSNYLQELRSRV